MTTINLNNVTRVDWNGGEDNITQIRLKKGNKTTVIWERAKRATFNVTLVRDNTLIGPGWNIGRITGTYNRKTFPNIPTIRDGGDGYKVGAVYRVSIPSIVMQNAHTAGNEGFQTKSASGAAAKPMLFYVDRVRLSNGNESTTKGNKGAIVSGDFLMYPEETNLTLIVGPLERRLLLAQKYTFTRNTAQQTTLYSQRSSSWTTIATAEDPEGIELPQLISGNIRFYAPDIRQNAYLIPLETWNLNELQANVSQQGGADYSAR